MDQKTVESLSAVNRRFYEQLAAPFSDSRAGPWPGWTRLLQKLPQRPAGPLSVLDLGCGNGRFGRYLHAHLGRPLAYLGLDESAALLRRARAELCGVPGAAVRQADLLQPEGWGSHDLVAAFGLLHHVPAFRHRCGLLQRAAAALSPGGLLAVTFWQLADKERFAARIVPWQEQSRYLRVAVDEQQLEDGDLLLRWGRAGDGVRYCHHCSAGEVDRLAEATGLSTVDRYLADGKTGDLNLYLILQR